MDFISVFLSVRIYCGYGDIGKFILKNEYREDRNFFLFGRFILFCGFNI